MATGSYPEKGLVSHVFTACYQCCQCCQHFLVGSARNFRAVGFFPDRSSPATIAKGQGGATNRATSEIQNVGITHVMGLLKSEEGVQPSERCKPSARNPDGWGISRSPLNYRLRVGYRFYKRPRQLVKPDASYSSVARNAFRLLKRSTLAPVHLRAYGLRQYDLTSPK